jgi:hypothetical protein
MKPKVYSFLGGLSGLGSTREESPPSGENFSPKGDDEAERITRLDAERNARDKAIGRGADYAPTVRFTDKADQREGSSARRHDDEDLDVLE